jgi:hypothetical protein
MRSPPGVNRAIPLKISGKFVGFVFIGDAKTRQIEGD